MIDADHTAARSVALAVVQRQTLLVQEELKQYGAGLLEKPALVIANKCDKVEHSAEAVKDLEAATGLPTIAISGQTGQNMQQLRTLMRQLSPTEVPL